MTPAGDRISLAHWRRAIAELYAQVRANATTDPQRAADVFRAGRDRLFRTHPDSPIPARERAGWAGASWYRYDPAWRTIGVVKPLAHKATFDIALAADGKSCDIPIESSEVRKLVGTVWFRSVFSRFSRSWRDRLFEVLIERVPLQNQVLKLGGQCVPLSQASVVQLNDIAARTDLPDLLRADVLLLTAIGRLWGEEALRRCQFSGELPAPPSKLGMLLRLRG